MCQNDLQFTVQHVFTLYTFLGVIFRYGQQLYMYVVYVEGSFLLFLALYKVYTSMCASSLYMFLSFERQRERKAEDKKKGENN